MNRAVVRLQKREVLAASYEALTKLAEEPRVPVGEVFEALLDEPPPEQGTLVPRVYRAKEDWREEAETIGLSDQEIEESWAWYERHAGQTVREDVPQTVWRVLTRHNRVEDDWRRDARAAGLSKEEIEDSWTWYARNAYAAPPVLEEGEQAVPDTMPESVRRVLSYNRMYLGLADDPLIEDLVDQFKHPIPEPLEREADDWRFWDDVGHAFTDPSSTEARQALDRLAHLVRLKPERARDLAKANGTTMEAAKRRLVQEAVLLSLGAADERIRIGRRRVKDDPGHPITLEDVFGHEGLQEILSLARMYGQFTDGIRDELTHSLGGPFRPAHLADRVVYRNWLTKEIRLQTEKLLGQDLDIPDPGRRGGSRRKVVSYDEAEPLPGVPQGRLGPKTRAFTDNLMSAAGEREDQEKALFRANDYYAKQLRALEKKDRMERALADRIDWQRLLERIWRENDAPVLRQFIDCVLHEPRLMNHDVAAARQLGWSEAKVRDVKRRLNAHIAQIVAERRWKSHLADAS